jgi:hypothetical protein
MGFAFLMQLRQQLNDVVPRRGGSGPGKAVNKNRHRDAGAMLLHSNYFADDATNTPKEFWRLFRMNKDLFMKIVQGVRVQRLFQVQERLHRKVGFTSVQKCTAAVRCCNTPSSSMPGNATILS